MAGAWTTLSILDGGGTSRTIRAWDESGVGTGPFTFAQLQADGSGSGSIPAVKAASTAPATTDPALVVAISPNSINANGQTSAANSAPIVGATGTIAGGSTGTAGSAASTVVTVQGIASGTVVPTTSPSGTIAAGTTGTAGSASSNVVTVQGIASGTVIPTTSPSGTIAAGSTGTAGVAATTVVTIQGIASGVAVPISGSLSISPTVSSTGTESNVAGNASSVTVLASNSSRLGASVYNDSTAILYLLNKTGGTASTSVYTVQLAPDSYYEVPFNYTGALIGIWVSATGNARVTEYTA